ncbi:MAG: HAD-IIIC family phosphatase [Cyanobacteria bacterium P01_E01_bin.6]
MLGLKPERVEHQPDEQTTIKCVVWDLDNTLWNGVLLEDEQVSLQDNVVDIIKTLDGRGILQSLASRNEHAQAIAKLQALGLNEYFLYPQINWNSKAHSIQEIAKLINISTDAIAFIDDQLFELEEVHFSLSNVLCINVADLNQLLDLPEMNPRFITEDSKKRRLMYLSDIERKQAEETFVGSQAEFLATLNMHFTIAPAQEADLQRAEELTMRTHQLNTTGYTYSYDELNQFRQSKNHKLLIASLEDKYGSYGKIGLALVECQDSEWIIKLLLMSCRVMSRGVGTVMLNYLIKLATVNNVGLQADFVSTDRNRMMYVAYKFAGFKEIERKDKLTILQHNPNQIQTFPDYIKVDIFE